MLDDRQSSRSDPGLRMLAIAVIAGASMIFLGLLVVAWSVTDQSAGTVAVSMLSDRSMHCGLIALIVCYYVYVQSR